MSEVDVVLRGDPSQTYAEMDFATRDRYRHVVERIAKRVHLSEHTVAAKAVELAQTDMSGSECKPDAKRKRDSAQHQERAQPSEDMRGSECNGNRAAHVGFYLIDKGLPELERQLGFDDPPWRIRGASPLSGNRLPHPGPTIAAWK